MKSNQIKIDIFIGYQVESEYHTSNNITKLGDSIAEQMSDTNISINIEYGEFIAGQSVLSEISNSIQKSNICIFDISENNPNVLFESGLALGQNKSIILLKNKKSIEQGVRPPSDLSDLVYVWYDGKENLDKKSTTRKVVDAIRDFVRTSHPDQFYLRSLWGLGNVKRTIIACSQIPTEHGATEYEEYIEHRRYADLDPLISVRETLHRLYPEMSILTTTAKSRNQLIGLDSSHLIIIGGLDLNPVFEDFEIYSPFSYDYGEKEEDIFVRDGTSSEIFQFSFDTKSERAQDHGFFVKRALEGSQNRKLIIIGGAHQWGVLGAARMFEYNGEDRSDFGYQNSRKIVERLGSDPHFGICKQIEGRKRSIDKEPIQTDEDVIVSIGADDQWNHKPHRSSPNYKL